jgi:CDP-glycerol glycerophosphotransferase (TagB/SpsB family)
LIFINIATPDNPNIWTFSSRYGFSENSKYIFLQVVGNHPEIRAIWISRDQSVVNRLNERGFEAYYSFSISAVFHQLRAKVSVQSHTFSSYEQFWGLFFKKSFSVNARHGTLGILGNYPKNRGYFRSCFRRLRAENMHSLYASNNVLKKLQKYGKDFAIYSNHAITGVPKNDVLYKDIKYSKLNTNDLLDNLIDSDYRLFLYIPTAMSHWDSPLRSFDENINLELIDNSLNQLHAKLIIKLHPKDTEYLGKVSYKNIIVLTGNNDIYPYLRHFDIIIGDYASILYDILHLDTPIIRYLFDINRPQLFDPDKEFIDSYRGPVPTESEYKPLVPCRYAFNVDELLTALNDLTEEGFRPSHNDDDRNSYFKFSDGQSSQRAIIFIKDLIDS